MKNPVGWFEIPVTDMARAIKCYNTIFGYALEAMSFGDTEMAWMPFDESENGAAGTLIKHDEHYQVAGDAGVLIYFMCDDVADTLVKVEEAGCKILQGKTQISEEHGYMAIFYDSEGNRIALHSSK